MIKKERYRLIKKEKRNKERDGTCDTITAGSIVKLNERIYSLRQKE